MALLEGQPLVLLEQEGLLAAHPALDAHLASRVLGDAPDDLSQLELFAARQQPQRIIYLQLFADDAEQGRRPGFDLALGLLGQFLALDPADLV